jgi:hypothetical protein
MKTTNICFYCYEKSKDKVICDHCGTAAVASIDKEIVKAIIDLNRIGHETTNCCAGHHVSGQTGSGYIMFKGNYKITPPDFCEVKRVRSTGIQRKWYGSESKMLVIYWRFTNKMELKDKIRKINKWAMLLTKESL